MSERVEKLIAQENAEIIRMLTDDEAIYVEAYYYLDKDGKRVYDMEMIREEFESNIETLITLNKQRGRASLRQPIISNKEISNIELAKYEYEQDK